MKINLYSVSMMLKGLFLPLFLFAEGGEGLPYVEKSFLIAKSTKAYTKAFSFSKYLARKTGIKLDLRGLKTAKKILLSESEASCKSQAFLYPCYIPRGRYDDGIYISIESSDGYEGFAPKYYMVIVASGEKIAADTLRRVKKYVSDAYVKKTSVYMGCMH